MLAANDFHFSSGKTYAWTATVQPSGSSPSFSNAAVAGPTVTLNKAGNYTFSVTVTDASSNTATGTVSVTVNQTATSIAITPSSAAMASPSTQTFAAVTLDQFGLAMASQPTFSWSRTDASSINASSGVYTQADRTGRPAARGWAGGRRAAAGGGGRQGCSTARDFNPSHWHKGIDVRQGGSAVVFRVSLKDGSGNDVTSGATLLYLFELQSDGSLKKNDFADNTFKTTALTTAGVGP